MCSVLYGADVFHHVEHKYYGHRVCMVFDVMDYTTLFTICAKVEPQELCRVNSVCHLNLRISKVHDNPYADLMYEVLADQNMWAVVGRTAGNGTAAFLSIACRHLTSPITQLQESSRWKRWKATASR